MSEPDKRDPQIGVLESELWLERQRYERDISSTRRKAYNEGRREGFSDMIWLAIIALVGVILLAEYVTGWPG